MTSQDISICGDISSATFFIVAGLIVPHSDFVIKNVGLNPTRTGILDVVKMMGGDVEILDKKLISNEEVDRITAVVKELRKFGADIDETSDGFIINGKKALKGDCEVDTYHDHRLAMSMYIAGLISENPVKINEFQWVDISFPEFETLVNQLL